MMETSIIILRYVLIAVGTAMATRGIIPKEQVATGVETIVGAIGGIVAALSALWGLYVRWNTKAVPAVTAAREDVPTVSPVTGQKIPGKEG